MPKQPPVAIRTLWEWATQAEREQAHRTATALMEYWMGQLSKQECAKRLELPMLRVWQLSNQAISGMVIGLLHPPKNARNQPESQDDPKKLKRRIGELEGHVKMLQRLIDILREMPMTREAMLLRDQVVRETKDEAMRLRIAEKNAKPARKQRELKKS
jgi:hypothetical protein